MAKQKGSDMLLKMDTASSGGPTFTTIAGVQNKSISISTDTVDVTSADSTNKWREMLAGAGIRKLTATGRGVFDGSAAEKAVRATLFAGTIKQWQVIVPGDGTYQGLMQVTQLEYAGEHSGEVSYNFRLESAGEITYTAA